MDIPTCAEGKFFRTPFRKFLWVLFQPFFYAIRPLVVNPKQPGPKDAVNIVSQVLFVSTMWWYAGPASILYLLVATFFGLGLHPCAGHFIAEHYTNIASTRGAHSTGLTPIKAGGKERGEQLYPDETFTYRGPLNLLSYHVGIHVAHHDFPFVSGFRLRELEKLAPEYYDHLPVTTSWPGTIWKYIFSDSNAYDRVKRKAVEGRKNQ